MGSLTALDIIVLVLVGGGAVLGFARGLVQEVTSLLAWLLAILAVRFFHATLTGLLGDHVGAPGGAAMLAFALLFGGVFGIVKRSEEHTSELQSLMRNSYAVFCLKQKNHKTTNAHNTP